MKQHGRFYDFPFFIFLSLDSSLFVPFLVLWEECFILFYFYFSFNLSFRLIKVEGIQPHSSLIFIPLSVVSLYLSTQLLKHRKVVLKFYY